jgi:hypothetical protein
MKVSSEQRRYEVPFEKSDQQPVESADDKERKRDFPHMYHPSSRSIAGLTCATAV